MKMRKSNTYVTILKAPLIYVIFFLFISITTNGQITKSFAQKIAQYDELGNFSCGLAQVKKGGKYGFIDKAGNEIVPCTYDNVGDFHDHMARVRKDFKDGYIDEMGELIIPCKYKQAQDFSEGLAWVNDNGPWRCIDNNGKVVFTLEIMSEFRSNFKDGLSVITPPEGESSIINAKGEVLELSGHSWLGTGISDGLILCTDTDEESGDTKYVYLDTMGNVVIDCSPQYGDYHPFHNGLAAVLKYGSEAEGGCKVGYIDKSGKLVIPISLPCSGFDDMPDFPDPFTCQDDMICSTKQVGNYGEENFGFLFGFYDRTGKLVVPHKYNKAQDFSGGLAAVLNEDGKWGYIDKTGKVVIPFKYDAVSYEGFQDGYALVELGDKQGYVDKQGNDTFSMK